jgi:hypothetical protein
MFPFFFFVYLHTRDPILSIIKLIEVHKIYLLILLLVNIDIFVVTDLIDFKKWKIRGSSFENQIIKRINENISHNTQRRIGSNKYPKMDSIRKERIFQRSVRLIIIYYIVSNLILFCLLTLLLFYLISFAYINFIFFYVIRIALLLRGFFRRLNF